MEGARCDVPAEKVRSYVDELDDTRIVMHVSDQIPNMEEEHHCLFKGVRHISACMDESDINHVSLAATIDL
jgi:hypothetical protein